MRPGLRAHEARDAADTLRLVVDEVLRVLGDLLRGDIRVVGELLVGLAGNRVVLETGVHPYPALGEVLADVLERQVVANIAVEVAVRDVAGVALLRRPDRVRRGVVAAEGRHTVATQRRSVDPRPRPVLAEDETVRRDEEVLCTLLCEVFFEPRRVSAFGEPEAARRLPEDALVRLHAHLHLRASGRRVLRVEREEGMRRRCGEDLDAAALVVVVEAPRDVPVVGIHELAEVRLVQRPIALGHRVEQPVVPRALDLAAGELDHPLAVGHESLLQQLVLEHCRQRRRDGERETEGHAIGLETAEHAQQRKVGLRDRLEEPRLFEKRALLRMSHEGEMGMEEEDQVAAGHIPSESS